MMREGGVDYGIIYPKIVQTSAHMHILQLEREAIPITKLTESHKELQYFLTSDKFTTDEKMDNFDLSCAAYTIFSYLFGGFYHDSDSIYIYPTGHLIQVNFDHIIGFQKYERSKVEPFDLFCTNEISGILGLNSRFADFIEIVWKGFRILRNNYVAVMQAFKLTLSDWGVSEKKMDELYQRFMIRKPEADAKGELLNLCKKGTTKMLTSFDKSLS